LYILPVLMYNTSMLQNVAQPKGHHAMNANQVLALNWAKANTATKAAFSDQFFAPFTKQQAIELARALLLNGIMVCAFDPKQSKAALLVKATHCGRIGDSLKDGIGIHGLSQGYDLTVVSAHKFVL
jgi:hypothetical protein